MAKQSDYPVLIPYSELCALLDATKCIKEYKREVEILREQMLAMRIIQQECIEKIGELKKML